MQDLTTFLAHHPLLSGALFLVLMLVTIIEWLRIRRNAFAITPAQATQYINRENAVVVDIRSQDSFRQGHIIDAQSVSSEDIKKNPKKLEKFRGRPIIIVAAASSESQKIAALLLKHGYNVYSLAGGMPAWNEAQMPLVKG